MTQFTAPPLKLLFTLLLLIGLLGCATADPSPTTDPTAITETPTEAPAEASWITKPAQLDLPAGLSAEVIDHKFDRPTQFVLDGDQLWVAQLAGGENDTQGEVVRLNLNTGELTTIASGLDKPTGLLKTENVLWIATRDELLRLDLSEDGAEPAAVISDLPNNGRSNGTLTQLPSGEILYETSGNRRDEDSGKLWALDPETETVREVARGLKGAYAHVVDDNGRVWFTEVVDGSLDGVPLPDEINQLNEGANYGWPNCYGVELTGTDCTDVTPALTIFGASKTPTGITTSPFSENTLLVALWVWGEVVQVDMGSGTQRPFLENMSNPQHLLTGQNGAVWISDYAKGEIYRIQRSQTQQN